MPSSVRSEKFHSPSMEYGFDAVPSLRTHVDENLSVNYIDPKVLRRATLKIDCYLIPIIGMFCELSLSIHSIIITHRSHFKIFCLF